MRRTEINKLFYVNEIEQREICEAIGRSQSYLSDRVTGRKPFTIDEIYIICDLTGVAYEEIHKYFKESRESRERRKIN